MKLKILKKYIDIGCCDYSTNQGMIERGAEKATEAIDMAEIITAKMTCLDSVLKENRRKYRQKVLLAVAFSLLCFGTGGAAAVGIAGAATLVAGSAGGAATLVAGSAGGAATLVAGSAGGAATLAGSAGGAATFAANSIGVAALAGGAGEFAAMAGSAVMAGASGTASLIVGSVGGLFGSVGSIFTGRALFKSSSEK